MSRYWRIYRVFVVSSIERDLEFRANFVAKVLQNTWWMGFFLLLLLVLFSNVKQIAGWTAGNAVVLGGTCFGLRAVWDMLFFSILELPEHVRRGTLDYILAKPVDSQFWVSVRKFNFSPLGTFFGGVGMLLIGLHLGHTNTTPLSWLAYLVTFACGITMFYSLGLTLMTTSIWFVRVDNLWVLCDSVFQVSQYPLDIYTWPIRQFLTFVLPLAFIAFVPAQQLVRGADVASVGYAVLYACVALALSRLFWRFACSQYTSASS